MVSTLRDYVDNLMVTRTKVDDLRKFRSEATEVLENGKFHVHKRESNVLALESGNMPNPRKIFRHGWDKARDTLKVQVHENDISQLTKRAILSRLGRIYDPLGVISPTTVKGKRIHRNTCEGERSWNVDVSPRITQQWNNWTKQLRDVEVPRSLVSFGKTKGIDLRLFSDGSTMECCTAAIAVAEDGSGKSKGLLASKSRLSKRNTSVPRLELDSGHMKANLARNLTRALKRLPIRLVIIWMDSLVSLYWIVNPGKSWKTFVSNCVKKIAEITQEVEIQWKICPSGRNLADIVSRGGSLNNMEKSAWFKGRGWLLKEEEWPEQPSLKSSIEALHEEKHIWKLVHS